MKLLLGLHTTREKMNNMIQLIISRRQNKSNLWHKRNLNQFILLLLVLSIYLLQIRKMDGPNSFAFIFLFDTL